jgi:hypothetical protein
MADISNFVSPPSFGNGRRWEFLHHQHELFHQTTNSRTLKVVQIGTLYSLAWASSFSMEFKHFCRAMLCSTKVKGFVKPCYYVPPNCNALMI